MTVNKKNWKIGIDLGGTKIETVLLAPDGSATHRERIPTPRDSDLQIEYDSIRKAVFDLIQHTLDKLPGGKTCTIGIGIPGTINKQTRKVQNSNITSLDKKPFQQELEQLLGRPIGMENDANCFALAESINGAAKGFHMVFGIIMGSGCGGGLCINGQIHSGEHSIAGEWGHFSVDPLGERCYCGNLGCVETKISGNGMARAFEAQYGKKFTLEQIVQGYHNGKPDCVKAFEQFIDDFGRCAGGLISVLDPDAVVIGGGVSNIKELYTLGVEKIRNYAYHRDLQTPILKNSLGDSAGVFGAAWIGR
ncbi:MAG: ROK family protein [Desulfobacteraceae bacterium]|nr:ROK family protein [Desulfobacteraceae bacterium]